MVGTFFIKASTYEFSKLHALGGSDSYFYSFEHFGPSSLWNFLYPFGIPGDPIPRGVTQGDELLYIFDTKVFDLTPEDMEVARVISNLWANFVIYGLVPVTPLTVATRDPTSPEFPIRVPGAGWHPSQETLEPWPVWSNRSSYYRIDLEPGVRTHYIATWEDPDFNA